MQGGVPADAAHVVFIEGLSQTAGVAGKTAEMLYRFIAHFSQVAYSALKVFKKKISYSIKLDSKFHVLAFLPI